ncbi:Mitochondrial protein [Podosphaera aphanis]|nr:Mitochondrial protein [Podosphaera aphanis]
MLRSTRIRPFVCWQCLNRQINISTNPLQKTGRRVQNLVSSQTTKSHASSHSAPITSKKEKNGPGAKSTIREKLRNWENEHLHREQTEPSLSSEPSNSLGEEVINTVTHPFLSHLRLQSQDDEISEDSSGPYQDVEDGLEGIKRDYLIPGDLVDLRFGGNTNELALFVRRLEFQAQYYTMSGRWLHQRGTNVNIYFPNFVDPSEIDEIRKYLPQEDVPADQEDSLRGFSKALPRNIGAPLLKKMNNFWNEANAVYEATASKLDESHSIVAHPTKFRYATLSELAEEIFDGVVPRNQDGTFPKPALYALHRRIYRDTAGFTLANLRKARGETQYEIFPLKLTEEMARVVGYVRKYNNFNLTKGRSEKPVEIQSFTRKASSLIKKSRETRSFTNYGNIGPYTGQSEDELKPSAREIFDGTDLEIVRFLEVWTGLNSPSTLIACAYDSAGSTILRAIGQYNDPEILLSRLTAWTCLKEIGAIAPWQTVSEYGIRAPNTSCRLSLGPKPAKKRSTLDEDKMKHLRTNWKDLTAYCIDDLDAQELDDALSLEATNSPNEYWVHVHVADPTSFISPFSPESQYAQAHGDTIFLPDRKVPMLDHDMVMKYMSLAPGKPCLTLSAKLNLNGEILDSKVSPGIIGNVVPITPRVFSEVAEDKFTPTPPLVFSVGPQVEDKTKSRAMTQIHQLSEKDKNELKILNKLGVARATLLQEKGAAFMPNEQTSTNVYFKYDKQPNGSDNSILLPNNDPTIEIKVPGSSQDFAVGHDVIRKTQGLALSTMMQMAGQVAAKWCADRGIPIPYRVAIVQPSAEDPSEFHRNKILPFLKENKAAPDETVSKYLALIGPAHLSPVPAPHIALALESYTKVTSPLRRYLDMFVHWQINAALLEEKRSGRSLVGNTNEDFLPFTKAYLEESLPHMTRLERWAKHYQNNAIQEWKCQFLLRAWRFGEATLPTPLIFVARRMILGSRNSVYGELTCLAMKALMEVPTFMPFEAIRPGDIFEVAISDLNVASQKVVVEALRKLTIEEVPRLDIPST